MTPHATAAAAAILLTLAGVAFADPQPDVQGLKTLTIEELMQIDVTLVMRRPEPAAAAAAAVSIITADDIRRSGVTTIADAIALAGGVHVARFNSGTWATSPRGFNANTANKLLVMVDGRTVYSPLFSGVFWNTIDYVLADVDRIEVIRGPGATLWGANAVNGVINIVTRHAADTRGALLSVVSGNEDPAIVEGRYGGGAAAASWRAYGKFARRDDQKTAGGASAMDQVNRAQAGFRFDGGVREATGWMLSGDAFHSWFGFPDRPDGEFTDLNLQARWSRALSAASRVTVQSYYRHEYRRVPRQLTHRIDIGDLHVEYVTVAGRRHNLAFGAGARVNHDMTHGSTVIGFDPAGRTYPLFSAYAQDEFALRPDTLFLTGGLKVERNAFSGADWQPSVRARWMLRREQVLWMAASRAVRRPTRFEHDIVAAAPTGLVLARGSDDFVSEKLTAWEVGYRARPLGALSLEATAFAHYYDNVRSQEAPLAGVLPVTIGNSLNGRSAGIELAAAVQPVPRSRLFVSYTFLDTEITRDAGSRDVAGGTSEANDPHHLFTLRGLLDLPGDVEVDGWLRAVGELPNPRVPAYAELNARVGWMATPQLELAVIGQDLLRPRHPEFGPAAPQRLEFERSIRAQVTVRMRR